MQKGFTLIEVLVVVGLISLITGTPAFSFKDLNIRRPLENGVEDVVTLINEARSLTLSAQAETRYGVHLESEKIVLFSGGSYSSTSPANITSVLPSTVQIRNISLSGGGENILFDRLTGYTTNYGSLEVYLVASSTDFRTINVSRTGLAEVD